MDPKNYFESLFDMEKDKAVFDACVESLRKMQKAEDVIPAVEILYVIDQITDKTIVKGIFIDTMLKYAPQFKAKERGKSIDAVRYHINKVVSAFKKNKQDYKRRKIDELTSTKSTWSFDEPKDKEKLQCIMLMFKVMGLDLKKETSKGFDGSSTGDIRFYRFSATAKEALSVLTQIKNELGEDCLSGFSYTSDINEVELDELTLVQAIKIAEDELHQQPFI